MTHDAYRVVVIRAGTNRPSSRSRPNDCGSVSTSSCRFDRFENSGLGG